LFIKAVSVVEAKLDWMVKGRAMARRATSCFPMGIDVLSKGVVPAGEGKSLAAMGKLVTAGWAGGRRP
jgi:hypothetical protein